jgi:hypothetical protein
MNLMQKTFVVARNITLRLLLVNELHKRLLIDKLYTFGSMLAMAKSLNPPQYDWGIKQVR